VTVSLFTVLAISATITPADATGNKKNHICVSNESIVPIGVLHTLDGKYSKGTYDAQLSQGRCTNDKTYAGAFKWDVAEGFLIGPDYCANYVRTDPGKPPEKGILVGRSAAYFLAPNSATSYELDAYRSFGRDTAGRTIC
jgi:hypothetical protein